MADQQTVVANQPKADNQVVVESESIHSNSPLFIHSSNTPGSILVSQSLIGTENYGIWSRSMMVSLRAKNKLGFIDGSCRRHASNEFLTLQWERCNSLVLAWIFNTVSKEIFNGIVYATDAAQVWSDLEEQYHKVNGTRIYGIHREISNLSQGNDSVAAYYNHLKCLWDELSSLVSFPTPDSDSSRAYLAHLDQQKLL